MEATAGGSEVTQFHSPTRFDVIFTLQPMFNFLWQGEGCEATTSNSGAVIIETQKNLHSHLTHSYAFWPFLCNAKLCSVSVIHVAMCDRGD